MQNKTRELKILIIDDEPHILSALGREINQSDIKDSISVIKCESGEECLDYLKKSAENVFLVISDLRLNGISGSDLLIRVRTDYPDIMLILLTAYSDMPEIRKAVSAAIISLILKPWEKEVLVSEIKKALEIYQLKKKNIKFRSQIEQQLKAAGDFQKKILGMNKPEISYLTTSYCYSPAPGLHCSGDYFDIIELKNNSSLLIIGDVAGHGIKPSFVTGMIKVAASRMKLGDIKVPLSASIILSNLNKVMCDSLEDVSDIVITFQVALVDAQAGKISISNAGHFPAYIIREGSCIPLYTHGPAMGFSRKIEYPEITVKLQKNDIIAMYTDGLIDSPAEKDTIDSNRLKEILIDSAGSDRMCDEVFSKVSKLHPGNAYSDDVTILISRYQGLQE